MKTKLLWALIIGFLTINGCKKDVIEEPTKNYKVEEITINDEKYKKISGNIDENFTFSNDVKWFLSGGVFVINGSTLTILPGTQIIADESTTAFLSITQGSKIEAIGSSNQPIIFTTLSQQPGSWGGIIVNGYADINTGETAEGEGGTGIYGGNNDSDNSGIIKYVRVEYAGKILGTDNELNGFSFNGVGNGTTVEYIESYMGADDGIEFFGGTVNVLYAVSKGNKDDSFDWTHGWRGNGNYWYVEQLSSGGDRGIEADNNADNNLATPFSNPNISNVTLVGYDDGDAQNVGLLLREGTKGKFSNIKIYNFPSAGIKVTNQSTLDNITNNELTVSNINVNNNVVNFNNCSSFESVNNTTATGSGTDWMNGWSK